MDVTLTASQFPPLALGFFGLGTGYLIWDRKNCSGSLAATSAWIALSESGASGCRASANY
jgi:hypothetical protein